MEVTLNDDIDLFDKLLSVAVHARSKGLPFNLIGGAALQIWGRILDEPRAMTSDLDWALTAEHLPTQAVAQDLLKDLVGQLRALGFERPVDWRPSRSGRFQFKGTRSQIDVEFLCGTLPFGRASRREPAYEIVPLEPGEDPPTFYAAKTPWIDKVDRWLPIQVRGKTRVAVVSIPSIPSLALLKLKAVRDKLERVAEEPAGDSREYERNRLQRHGDDLLALVRWAEERGEFVEIVERVGGDAEVHAVACETEARLMAIDTALVHDHAALLEGIARLSKVPLA